MKQRSLILVTVDCLRADRVGFTGYGRPLVPFVHSLAKESITCSDAVVVGAPTYFSFPGIMASRHPLDLGRKVLGIAPGERTLAAVLRDSGYETAAFVAANPYLSPRCGYEQGFGKFVDFLDTRLVNETGAAPPASAGWSGFNRWLDRISRQTRITAAAYDELYFRYCQWRSGHRQLSMDQLRRYPAAHVLIDNACSWLKEVRERPFFLWIHLMDPHHPYYPPEEALQLLGMSHITAERARFLNSYWNRGDIPASRLQRRRAEVMRLYDAGVHWVDQQISRLVAAVQSAQRWTQTVFVMTADHGEEFLEHGRRYHSPNALAEQLIRVPLLIRAPEITTPRTFPGPFSHIHLAPTLLEGLGLSTPASFRGRSYWSEFSAGTVPRGPTITECIDDCNNPFSISNRTGPRLMAVRESDFKLVIRFQQGADDLYDLKDDPEERRPVPNDVHPKERARLLRYALEHLRGSRERRDLHLSLRARMREIRQTIELTQARADTRDAAGIETAAHG